MAWDYDERTLDFLDADGGAVANLSIAAGSVSVAFEGSEGYIGKAFGTATPTSETTDIEGSSAAAVGGATYDVGVSTLNLLQGIVQWWFLNTAKTGDVLADSNSVKIRVADSGEIGTNVNYIEYVHTGAVNGGDEFYPNPAARGFDLYLGGGANRGEIVGTGADLTDIRYVTLWLNWQAANSGGQQPAFGMDWIKFGLKFTCTGTETLDGLRSFSEGDPTNRFTDPDYGLVRGQNIFYDLWAGIDVGDGTTATTLSIEDSIVYLNLFAEEVPYDINVENNATLNLGRLDDQAQADYPVGGSTIVGPDEVYISSLNVKSGGTLNCFSSRLFRLKNFILGESASPESGNPTIDIRDSDIDTVRNVEFRSTAIDVKNTKFHDPLPTWLNAGRAWQDDGGAFTDITTNWNNTGTTTAIFPTTEAVNDAHTFGFNEQFSAVEFEIQTAGVAGVVTWEYWNGSSWSALTNVQDDTVNFTAGPSKSTATNRAQGAYDRFRVTWDIPSDWATQVINSSGGQLYYVRARITTIFSTNPVIQQAQIGQRRLGILVDAPNSLEDVTFFKCDRALYFQSSVTVNGYLATDNAYDIVTDDLLTITLVDSTFDPDKILQI